MKPRHAAALALVGWYLLVPAPGDETQPLSYWSHVESYDTAKECQQGLHAWYDQNERHGFVVQGFTPAQIKSAWLMAECIETVDPRLKGN